MGHVYATVELVNGYDLECAERHIIGEEEVKRMHINVMVDTGAAMLCINENIQEILQFSYDGTRTAVTADGRVIKCQVVKGVELQFENRRTTCRAMVLPGDSEPLLGVIPLEDLDVMIHPLRQELIVNPEHPDMAHMKLKKQSFRVAPLNKRSRVVCAGQMR
ncbi:MAG TPA: retroviral-like aspartic protease family protein [Puia sp.]|jgi:clan AA aspartic protease